MQQIFQDLRVIDAASFLAGPGAGTVMSDFGADVIKIEPLHGDGYRKLVGNFPVDYNWQLTSRNKRSIALDLDCKAGRGVLSRLLQDADVVLVNFVGEQLTRFGLDYQEIKGSNPRLIYAHLTGYGTSGPDASKRAFDSTAWWARTGMMDLVREPGQAPMMGVPGFGDHSSAMSLFGAIMLGLYRRERTGEGSYVSTSLVANGVWANGMQLQGVIAGFDLGEKRQQQGWSNPFTSVYGTNEDRFVMLTVINPGREWPQLCKALGHDEWLEDERFVDMRTLFRNRLALIEMIGAATGQLSLAELTATLDAHAVTYGVVNQMSEVVHDPQLRANDVIVETGSDDETYPFTIASPISVAEEPKRSSGPAPQIGEHSSEILAELGLSDSDIADLIEAGVVHQHSG
ncbi:MAG: CaiB/BaiF CoA-transferase family protein [Gammaproteobacteria bacterium]|nr:CaiB/BaiF CoA-transferase family protein [Gammaproteobacteria bacterium]